jgi:hypothetical protein
LPPMETRHTGRGIERRDFLRLLVIGAAAAVIPVESRGAERRRKKKTKKVFRLSVHKRRCCKACKGHAANRYYRTQRAAKKDRAHPGCNCAIVTQVIDRELAKKYFPKRTKVHDVRSEVV